MRCPSCGSENPPEMKFCTKCGTKLEGSPPATDLTGFCPQCGSQVSPETQFCGHCGAKFVNVCPQCGSETTPGTRFCSQCGHDTTKGVIRQVARGAPAVKRAFPLPNIIAAGVGAIMMLVSLAVPWYTIRLWGDSVDVTASDLMTETDNWELTWAGSALPVILVIIFASIVLLSVAYSFWTRVVTTGLWAWLGTLAALCVIGNAVYFLWWVYDHSDEWVNIVQAGSALAFVGALVTMFSSVGGKRATEEHIT